MWRIRRSLVLLAILMSGIAPVLALSEPSSEERDENRQLLEKWSADPEHWAQLQRNLAAFRSLPPEQQERLRRLDRDFRREDPATQARLRGALDRYTIWLSRLSEEERREIQSAANVKERLQAIKRIRHREWLARLPKGDKDRLQAAKNDEERLALTLKIRQEELLRRDEWQVARQFWKELMNEERLPSRPGEFPLEVQSYLKDCLWPVLNADEKKRLDSTEGHWPLYPRTLVELADRHPPPLPGPIGPTRLPPETIKRLGWKASVQKRLQAGEGKWPEFGVLLKKEIALHKKTVKTNIDDVLPPRFTPADQEAFPAAVQQFITQELMPILDPEERKLLDQARGQWPQYPKTIADLARNHNLQVPGMSLPNRAYWDKYRTRN